MTDRITGKQFDESPGVEDWRALWGGGFASTYFPTGSFGAGAVLVQAIDALAVAEVRPFWRAVLGYREVGDEDVLDPHRCGPPFTFQQMDTPRPQRNRIHIDVYVPRDQAQARIAAALAAGGHMANDTRAPHWWTLADAEGNEVDLAIWG